MVRSRRVDMETADLGVGKGGGGWEEYIEYIFPDTAAEQPNRRLLAFANKWAMGQGDSDDEESDTDGGTQLSDDLNNCSAQDANTSNTTTKILNFREIHSYESDRDE